MSLRRLAFLVSFVLAACGPLAASTQPPACTTGNVQTSSGPVCGMSSPINIPGAGAFTANAYLGIPYAQPPVGPQRWTNPVPPEAWTATFQATRFGNECPQFQGTITKKGVCSFKSSNQSEDCLYLNVWTPTGATPSSKLPVLLFIHGGAFEKGTGGSSTTDLLDGTYLAASQNVIVVTFNYRLGALGFLATREMPTGAGNFGFRDQLLAMSWVQQNIAGFGGDPSRVMLFGESAGAMSVGLHALTSTQSAGLFKAALMESNPLGLPYKTLQQAMNVGKLYSDLLRCSDLDCLRKRSACELAAKEASPLLLLANPSLEGTANLSSVFSWTPVIDGSLITGQPIDNAGNLKVPMLMGTNRDEGIVFTAMLSAIATRKGYEAALDRLFGRDNTKTIEAISRYSCTSSNCTLPLANVITDYVFTCANRQLALQASNVQKLYMYQFNQVSSFNFWAPPNGSMPACQGEVCHADELPYVFNTARALDQIFQPAEEASSQTIGGYWASFAKSQSPGSAWPLFNADTKTYLMLNVDPTTASDPLDAAANCTSLWDKIGYQNVETWDRLLAGVKTLQKASAR